jgi:homoserine O-acetyltransferase/O-succinyltransferase
VVDSRIIKSSIDNQFEVESYLHYKGNTFVERFDANAYIYVTRALDLFDLSRETESLEESCHSLPNQNLFLTMSTDWLFPPEDTLKLHEVLLSIDKKSEYHMIESIHGHDGFLLEVDQMTPYIKNFLKNIDS